MVMQHYGIYDIRDRRLLSSNEITQKDIFISPNGGVLQLAIPHKTISMSPRYMALRSTGLKDMRGDVIHEYHVLEYHSSEHHLDGARLYVKWERGAFRLYKYPINRREDFQTDNIGNMVTEQCFTIVGHDIFPL